MCFYLWNFETVKKFQRIVFLSRDRVNVVSKRPEKIKDGLIFKFEISFLSEIRIYFSVFVKPFFFKRLPFWMCVSVLMQEALRCLFKFLKVKFYRAFALKVVFSLMPVFYGMNLARFVRR